MPSSVLCSHPYPACSGSWDFSPPWTWPFPHHHPHPSPHSLPGSFDSAQGPPTTPMYNHVTQQPLSPRHFPSGGGGVTPVPPPAQAHHNASSPLAVVVPDQKADPRLTGHPPPESKPIQIPASEIPKLIHETSI